MKLGSNDINKLIPHRSPFLFIDEVYELNDNSILGLKHIKSDEYFFKGHFPGNPIVPGVILVESLAQTAGIVVSQGFSKQKENSVLFTSVSNAKFRKPVLPNDEILFEVKFLNQVKSIYKFYGEAKKESEKVCEAVFSAMVADEK